MGCFCLFSQGDEVTCALQSTSFEKIQRQHDRARQEFIDIVETIYRGARKGRGLVMSPKDAAHDLATYALAQNCSGSDSTAIHAMPCAGLLYEVQVLSRRPRPESCNRGPHGQTNTSSMLPCRSWDLHRPFCEPEAGLEAEWHQSRLSKGRRVYGRKGSILCMPQGRVAHKSGPARFDLKDTKEVHKFGERAGCMQASRPLGS